MNIKVFEKAERSEALKDSLVKIWQRSVAATHHFLSDQDIQRIAPSVSAALCEVDWLAVAYSGDEAVAFAGAQNGKLEMLFCDALIRWRGWGSALLGKAIEKAQVHRLDVNEDNAQAREFYQHRGFEVLARSATDGAGQPFPVLHLESTSGVRAGMASGTWFNASHPHLQSDHSRARETVRAYNATLNIPDKQRRKMLQRLLGSFGDDSVIMDGLQVDFGYRIFVGARCFFNYHCTFLDGAPIVFGDDVLVGPGCTFATPLHPLVAAERAGKSGGDASALSWERNLPITVGDGVWIASNVLIGPGIRIGKGAVIGAGSVLTRDVPEQVLAFGNPCRVVRPITDADRAFHGSTFLG